MGKIFLMPDLLEKEVERRWNMNQLKTLVNQYITSDKNRVIAKIKEEQSIITNY